MPTFCTWILNPPSLYGSMIHCTSLYCFRCDMCVVWYRPVWLCVVLLSVCERERAVLSVCLLVCMCVLTSMWCDERFGPCHYVIICGPECVCVRVCRSSTGT